MYHHGTIRKYTAALLDLFNDLEIQYEDSQGNIISRNIPLKYSSIEKTRVLDNYTTEQLASGNTNVLPRAALAMSTMVKSEARTTNKNIKIAKIKTEDTFEWMYNSVPYEFTFELAFICRGMNEASMIVEQLAPKFNPTINIDVWDATNLDEPTRVPVKLLDIGIEQAEYDETSSNLVFVNCGLSIQGNLYPPVRSTDRIKEFKMNMNEWSGNFFTRKEIMGWDVNENGEPVDGRIISYDESENIEAPSVIAINGSPVIGENELTAVVDNISPDLPNYIYEWSILLGDATIVGDGATANLVVNGAGQVEVQLKVIDYFNRYSSLDKTFTIS
jgi:hypothetical protein